MLGQYRLDVVICYLIEKKKSYAVQLQNDTQGYNIDFTDGRMPDKNELEMIGLLPGAARITMSNVYRCFGGFPDIDLPVDRH